MVKASSIPSSAAISPALREHAGSYLLGIGPDKRQVSPEYREHAGSEP